MTKQSLSSPRTDEQLDHHLEIQWNNVLGLSPAWADEQQSDEDAPFGEDWGNSAKKIESSWHGTQGLTNHKFDLERKDLALRDIMEAPLLQNKEDIEDVCISALKEKDIEAKLKMVTTEWTLQELKFQVFKNRGELLLRGDTTAETVGQAEDSLMVLGSLLSNR